MTPAYEPTTVTSDSPRWFIDAGIGGAWSNASALHFINPIGTAFTDNDVSGERIHLNEVDKKDSSVGAVFSAGYIHDLTDRFYVDAFGEIGASILKVSAKQGANLYPDDYGVFPSKAQTNFAGGLGLGVGYKFTENIDFTVTDTYH